MMEYISPYTFAGLPTSKRRDAIFKIRNLDFDTILERVAKAQNIAPESILLKSRKQEVVDARMKVIYLSLKTGKYTLQALGSKFKKDHSTIIYNRDAVIDRMSVDKHFKNEMIFIEDHICK